MSCQRFLLSVVLALAASYSAIAQNDAALTEPADHDESAKQAADDVDREPIECLQLARVRRTEIIDETTIVFYTSRKEGYVNNLPRRCPGLRTNSQFMYEVNQSRLCETDWITVLERFGVSVGRGFTCRLGVFHPATEETIAILRRASETGLGRATSTATPVELPPEAEDGESGEEEQSPRD